jgi:DNA repair protein RecO (recombination protein O)
MNFQDQGIIIAKRTLKESSFIISAITANHGIYSGVVSRISKKLLPLYQPGNLVDFFWQARLHEDIGLSRCELVRSFSAQLMSNKLKLYAFNSIINLIKISFIEREPHNNFFPLFKNYLEKLSQDFDALDYIKLELDLIREAGYRLDLTTCAATGESCNLAYVSPKSGRAVSKQAGEPYAHSLLPLPNCLTENHTAQKASSTELIQAFAITSYFFNRYIFHNNEPEERKRFITYLCS